MHDPEVTEYIRDSYNKGYALHDITQSLIQSGHDHNKINESLKELFGQDYQSHHSLHYHKHSHFLIASIATIIVLSTLLIVVMNSDITEMISNNPMKIYIDSSEPFKSGSSLSFTRQIDTALLVGEHTINYTIADAHGSTIYDFEEEVSGISDNIVSLVIPLPSGIDDGSYTLIAEMKYLNEEYTSKDTFRIEGMVIQKDKPKHAGGIAGAKCPSCDDGNACTREICSESTGYACTYEQVMPCCGNFVCEDNEKNLCKKDCSLEAFPQNGNQIIVQIQKNYQSLQQAMLLSKSDMGSALNKCESLRGDEYFYDECMYEVSKIRGDISVCQKINDQNKRDGCLMNLKECQSISDRNLKEACESIKLIEELDIPRGE